MSIRQNYCLAERLAPMLCREQALDRVGVRSVGPDQPQVAGEYRAPSRKLDRDCALLPSFAVRTFIFRMFSAPQ